MGRGWLLEQTPQGHQFNVRPVVIAGVGCCDPAHTPQDSLRKQTSILGPLRAALASGSGGSSAPLLETLPAKYRPSLGRLKGNSGFLATLRTDSPGFHAGIGCACGRRSSQSGYPFRLARFAALRLVFELLVEKEKLFARRKYELSPAVHAFQDLVLELHATRPLFGPVVAARDSTTPRSNYAPRLGPTAHSRGARPI